MTVSKACMYNSDFVHFHTPTIPNNSLACVLHLLHLYYTLKDVNSKMFFCLSIPLVEARGRGRVYAVHGTGPIMRFKKFIRRRFWSTSNGRAFSHRHFLDEHHT